jgi:DNA (cytosine-5)-methyltransferase 1
MNELALFAGAGGGILGGHLLGWRTVCAVEWEPYPASVLCARQNDGFLPPFPVWDDVQTFDGKPWRGIVDVVSGGFPCQDISAAGRGEGIDGERSGMWREMARIIHEVRPKFVFVENSPMLTSRGLGRVLGDLASMGFDARWGVLGAADVGANHQRDRIWIVGNVAHSSNEGLWSCGRGNGLQSNTENRERCNFQGRSGGNVEFAKVGEPQDMEEKVSNALPTGLQGKNDQWGKGNKKWQDTKIWGHASECSWWEVEPNVGRVVDGVASRVDRLKAIGNGQVSEVARRAWEVLGDL